jgi:hypothetical protein
MSKLWRWPPAAEAAVRMAVVGFWKNLATAPMLRVPV